MSRLLLMALVAVMWGSRGSAADESEAKKFECINLGEIVFIAKLTKETATLVNPTNPPIRHFTLQFADAKILRGALPKKLEAGYRIVLSETPNFPKSATWLVVAHMTEDGRLYIDYLTKADEKVMALATQAASLPIGWTLQEGRPVSPWSTLGKLLWPEKEPVLMGPACPISGRPALLCGKEIAVATEQVIAANPKPFDNPYGDGQFKITVSNKGKEPAKIHALLTDGKTIFWEDSLVFVVEGKLFIHPKSGRATGFKPVELKPGESVSGAVDTLPLRGVAWPRGGSRVNLQICLGEKSSTNFFYYSSKFHDPLRDAAIKTIDQEK
jgi:hypothetical protein